MFFTSRNRINRSRKQGASNSKSSDKSVTHNICKKKPNKTDALQVQVQGGKKSSAWNRRGEVEKKLQQN